MSFFAHFALTIAANGGSGWITVSVSVVGFLMPIDRSDQSIDKSAIAQAIFKLNKNREW
ncbi:MULTISPECIES: hypothetical protein [unclassified Microcoleus]|uniref:hypothetical protein n=1 Tax=unclassified Microcoleus TaxID=2642155 RepID=UPI002FD21432